MKLSTLNKGKLTEKMNAIAWAAMAINIVELF